MPEDKDKTIKEIVDAGIKLSEILTAINRERLAMEKVEKEHKELLGETNRLADEKSKAEKGLADTEEQLHEIRPVLIKAKGSLLSAQAEEEKIRGKLPALSAQAEEEIRTLQIETAERKKQMEATLNDIKKQVSTVKKELEDTRKEKTSIEDEKYSLSSSVTSLRSTINGLESAKNEIDKDILKKKEDLLNLESDIETSQELSEKNKKKIADQKKTLYDAEQDILDAEKRKGTAIEDAKKEEEIFWKNSKRNLRYSELSGNLHKRAQYLKSKYEMLGERWTVIDDLET